MKKSALSLLLVILISTAFAQQGILFTRCLDHKEILIREGDQVKFSYNGYIGQKEIKSGVVFSIGDSVVGIIAPVSSGRFSAGATETRYIYVKDITGFRKFRRSRPYLMALSSVAITVGTIFLFYEIDKNTNLTFAEKLGLSIGSGIISTIVVRAAFPERIKNKVGKDWELKVLK